MRSRIVLQFAAILSLIAPASRAQSAATQPKTTSVLVILTSKPAVTREQIMKVMPEEIRATVRLYLDGKIREWHSRGDGKGVIFMLDCKDSAEARSIMEDLPLAKENVMDYEFIPLGPLMPLAALLGSPTPRQ